MNLPKTTPSDNPLTAWAQLVCRSRFEDLSPLAVAKAKVFLMDTLACGVAGRTGPHAHELAVAAQQWGQGNEAVVWGSHLRAPAAQAAVINGYRIHALEWDCVHEPAVVHPMATLLPALLAFSERSAAAGRPVSGQQFLLAMTMGVEIAATLGAASKSVMRFFRPATCGGFGVVAGLGVLASLDEATVMNAFGIQYGQTSGTMQAHVEGSMLLGLQVGFNGRAGLTSVDLAMAGMTGPQDILTGPYGYYTLFETEHDIAHWWPQLGQQWHITELSHKPFPSGRLTHAAVDAVQQAVAALNFGPNDLKTMHVGAPPLTYRLVGRPDIPNPQPNYARLCIPYVVAATLSHGTCTPASFAPQHLSDPALHALAAKVQVSLNDNPDVNALWPQQIRIELHDGRVWEKEIHTPIGHPDNPLSAAACETKFRQCWGIADMPASQGDALLKLIDGLESVADVSALTQCLVRTP